MLPDLGIHPELWEKRHKLQKKIYGKNKYWLKGYDIGKEGGNKSENPYMKQMDLDLCRKVLFWIMGWEEGAYSSKYRNKRLKKFNKEESRRRKKEAKREAKLTERAEKHKAKRKKNKKKHRTRKTKLKGL